MAEMIGNKVMLRDLKDILSPERVALIIVDMQVDFCSPEGLYAQAGRDISKVASVIPNIFSILKKAREKGVFVVHLQQCTLPYTLSDSGCWRAYKTRDGKSPEYALKDTHGQEIVEALKPLSTEVVVQKFRNSGFHATFLDQLLRANGIESVLLTGTTTEGCVLSTALDASFHDYYTCVVEDCMASSMAGMHDNAIAFMKTRFFVPRLQDVLTIWNQV